jgi:hypothetical protein
MPYIVKNGVPFKAFPTLAEAWIECFDRGFIILKAGKRKPGQPGGRPRYGLAPGIHVIDEALLGPKKPRPPSGRGRGSKKRKFKTENWIDAL